MASQSPRKSASRNSDVALSRRRKERDLRRRSIKRARVTKYYAVQIGAQPGIYQNWNDCLAQITGYPKAKYKSFTTREDAQDFVDGGEGDVRCANKWIGVRVGRVPGVYSTLREAVDQTRDDPKAKYQFFTSKAEAENYVNPSTTPYSQRRKRKLPESTASQIDQSRVKRERSHATPPSTATSQRHRTLKQSPASVKKERNHATPQSAAASRLYRVPSHRLRDDDEIEDEVQTPSKSVSVSHVDSRGSPGVEQNREISRLSDSSSEAEQSSAERSSAERSSAERSSAERSSAERSSAERSSAERSSVERVAPERPAKDSRHDVDIDALSAENARLKAEVRRLSQAAAGLDSSPGRSRHHVTDACTVVLACQDIDHTPSDHHPAHPETRVTVHGVYSSNADANLAAMQVFQDYCPRADEMKIVDLGVTSDCIDKTKMTASMCQQRRTPEGELRLIWRDSHGRFGFVKVQRKLVHDSQAMRPNSYTQTSESYAVGERASRSCYLVCEHYGSNDNLRQDGGMLAAFNSKDRANSEAERIFRKHFLKNSSEPILEASEEFCTDVSTETPSSNQGVWRYMQRGRSTFFKRNEHGETKVWVHKFEVQ